MLIKDIIYEDFINYKKPSMFIIFPTCNWKCEKDCGKQVCQNSQLAQQKDIEVSYKEIVTKYINNNLTKAIVMGGLEPFDSWDDLKELTRAIRQVSLDDIVIYTGYKISEILDYVLELQQYPNIIIKFGRYVPDSNPTYNSVLGVTLASDNQYALKIGDTNENNFKSRQSNSR